jgi:hypothetical protein
MRSKYFRCVALSATALLAACSESAEELQLRNVQEEIAALKSQSARCDDLLMESRLEAGERAKGVWDRAAAENVEIVSPEQEEEIRISLGRELGIAPSKVDWKGIYKRRAEQAAPLDQPTPADNLYERECGNKSEQISSRISVLEAEEASLKSKQ